MISEKGFRRRQVLRKHLEGVMRQIDVELAHPTLTNTKVLREDQKGLSINVEMLHAVKQRACSSWR